MNQYKHFFIVGGQRCGTTFLYNAMETHSSICMNKPVNPEPKYFIKNQKKLAYLYYVNKFFKHRKNEEILGEKSTSYLEFPSSGKFIFENFKDPKIIIALRNPVDRAISNYFFSKKNGLENRSIEEVFLENKPIPKIKIKTSVSPFTYIKRGEYIKFIKDYIRPFNKEQIGIFLYENFTTSKVEIQKIFSFLELNQSNEIQLNKKINYTKKDSTIDESIIEKLHHHYRPFNKKLEDFLQIDLSKWEN